MATYRAFLNLYNENDEKNTYLPYTDMDAVYSQNGYDDLIGTSHNIVKSSSPLTLRNALKVINKAVYDLKDGAFLPKVTTTTPYPGDSAVVTPNMVYQVQQDLNTKITAMTNRISKLESNEITEETIYDINSRVNWIYSSLISKLPEPIDDSGEITETESSYDVVLGKTSNIEVKYSDLYEHYKGKIIFVHVRAVLQDHSTSFNAYYSLDLTNKLSKFGQQKLRFLFGTDNNLNIILDKDYFESETTMKNIFKNSTIVGSENAATITFNVDNSGEIWKFQVKTYNENIFKSRI